MSNFVMNVIKNQFDAFLSTIEHETSYHEHHWEFPFLMSVCVSARMHLRLVCNESIACKCRKNNKNIHFMMGIQVNVLYERTYLRPELILKFSHAFLCLNLKYEFEFATFFNVYGL